MNINKQNTFGINFKFTTDSDKISLAVVKSYFASFSLLCIMNETGHYD